MTDSENCRASVIVPTRSRPDLLERALLALERQCDAPSYEVLIADDANSGETRHQVERWTARYHARGSTLRYLSTTTSGPAAARNQGLRAARGEIIAFTDDDCLPDSRWLAAGVAAMSDGVAGVSGRIIVPLGPRPTDYERNAAGLERADFATANCFYRRAALSAIGGFDERFSMAWREDADVYLTLLEQNCVLACAPWARVVHPARSAPWGVSVLQQRKSMFNALLYRKHPVLYRQRIQPAPPWRYYATCSAALGACVGLLTGRSAVARLAGACWLALTLRFCLMRLTGTSHAWRHVTEMLVTSALIPPVCVYWRLRGALRFRVLFL